MPVKDPIELGSGRLYFKGTDESIEVNAGDLIYAEEEAFTDDLKHISLSMEPITFECKAEFNRNWTLIKCVKCGYEFPITKLYALLCGTDGWICPGCKLKEFLEGFKNRRNE